MRPDVTRQMKIVQIASCVVTFLFTAYLLSITILLRIWALQYFKDLGVELPTVTQLALHPACPGVLLLLLILNPAKEVLIRNKAAVFMLNLLLLALAAFVAFHFVLSLLIAMPIVMRRI